MKHNTRDRTLSAPVKALALIAILSIVPISYAIGSAVAPDGSSAEELAARKREKELETDQRHKDILVRELKTRLGNS